MKLHRKIAATFGYELVKTRKLNDTLDQHLANLFDLYRVNCVIDVGANAGQYGAALRRSGYQDRILSFEPVEDTFAQLAIASNEDEAWRVFRAALGNCQTSMPINLTASSDFSSFYVPNNYGSERFSKKIQFSAQEEVQVTTLSHVWPDLVEGIDDPRVFLKLDTQGFDLEVLKGAESVLENIVGLQAEVSFKSIYEGMPDHIMALTEFQHLGFEVTGFYLVTRDPGSYAIIEYDCVLARAGASRS